MALLNDIVLPSRTGIRTVGDMAQIILDDEKAIRMKNADLAALRTFYERGQ